MLICDNLDFFFYFPPVIFFPLKVTIPELTESNTFIISVTATDRDSEMYGPVSYRIISPRKGFVINPTTGG